APTGPGRASRPFLSVLICVHLWPIVFRSRQVATYPVTFISEGAEVRAEVADDEYLFEAAARAGLEVPSMCLQGWCGACAGRVLGAAWHRAARVRLRGGGRGGAGRGALGGGVRAGGPGGRAGRRADRPPPRLGAAATPCRQGTRQTACPSREAKEGYWVLM